MLTRFEYARILGARALQISMGAPVLVEVDAPTESKTPENPKKRKRAQGDPILIAEREIKQQILPILVRRTLPDGRCQDIPLAYLLKHAARKH